MWAVIILSVVLLVIVALLVYTHVRTWRAAQDEVSDADDLDYYRRQFRRRMQASTMLGIVAVAMAAGVAIPHKEMPSLFVFYWCGVIVLVVWIGLLAAADMLATRFHISRSMGGRHVEHAQLQAELRRHRADQDTRQAAENKDRPREALEE